ncbi:MAG: hypothetical protein AAF138_03725 [Planctomycetota bacterium]
MRRLGDWISAACAAWFVFGAVAAAQGPRLEGLSPDQRDRAEQMMDRAVEYLSVQQDPDTGEWERSERGPTLPAITGLVVTGMLLDPDIDASDPRVRRAITAILSYVQEDGGIYDQILPSYNTAICLSALALAQGPDGRRAPAVEAVIPGAQRFLIGLQYSEDAFAGDELTPASETTQRVSREHPFYGGIGYGRNGRPDNSNLNLMLQALHDSGVPAQHEAYQRALVFLQRTQMLDAVNDMPYADGSAQGGFIYATGPDGERIGEGESKAGVIEETLSDGGRGSRLRAYGSMTYAGFKSFAYAELDADDPRVAAARSWIESNYTLQENPGIGLDGLYYYFMTFGRAMYAWGEPFVQVGADGAMDGGPEGQRPWRGDLVDRLALLQNDDGSFTSVDDRWMENNTTLITAYALIALRHAVRED